MSSIRTLSATALVSLVSKHGTDKDGARVETVKWSVPVELDDGTTVKVTLSAQGASIPECFAKHVQSTKLPFGVKLPASILPTSTVNGIKVTTLLSGRYLPAARVREFFGVAAPKGETEPATVTA